MKQKKWPLDERPWRVDIGITVSGEISFRLCLCTHRCPLASAMGQKAFSKYLNDESEWSRYDATELVNHTQFNGTILIDQGMDDKFLEEQLKPDVFTAACEQNGQSVLLRQHACYDHSYWFIQSFIEDHLRHHAQQLFA